MSDPSKEKQEFDLQVAHLSELTKGLLDNTAKVTGFLLLATGWLATAESARRALIDNDSLKILAACAVMSTFTFFAFASWSVFRTATTAFSRLEEMAYLPTSAYEGRRLGLGTLCICVGGNAFLAILLVAAILTLKCSPSAQVGLFSLIA